MLVVNSQRVDGDGLLHLSGSTFQRPVLVVEGRVAAYGIDHLTADLVVDGILVRRELERLRLVSLRLLKMDGIALGHLERRPADVALGIIGELADEALDDFAIVICIVLACRDEEIDLRLLGILRQRFRKDEVAVGGLVERQRLDLKLCAEAGIEGVEEGVALARRLHDGSQLALLGQQRAACQTG